MDKKQLQELLDQYDRGLTSPRQTALIEQWLIKAGRDAEERDGQLNYEVTGNKIWSRLAEQLNADQRGKTKKLWLSISAAAAVLVLISFVLFYVNFNSSQKPFSSDLSKAKTIAPGHYGATITLGDQSVIELDSSQRGVRVGKELTYDNGEQVISNAGKLSGNQMLIAGTSRGQTYIVTLSDGSKVWLNADSKLEFPSVFSGTGDRTVKLSGEGYFEITKDASRPFIVETIPVGDRKGQFVKVLGTHFNINSYGNEPLVKTTLIEGSVAISQTGGLGKARILKPGEQSSVGTNQMKVEKADIESVLSWKDNKFIFDYEDLPTVMRIIERWYGVKVVYDGPAPQEKIWGTITRYQDLSVPLKFIESTGKVHFRIEGRTVYVSR